MKTKIKTLVLVDSHHACCRRQIVRLGFLITFASLLLLPGRGAAQATHTLLHTFDTANHGGYQPENSLLLGSDGALYGTTFNGGTNGNGTVFRINTDGSSYTNLHLFQYTAAAPGDGWGPECKLIEDTNGVLYGTTRYGGPNNYGTVFKLNQDGSGYEVLYSFTNGTDAKNPIDGVILSSDGFLYGAAYAGGAELRGAVFKLNTNGTGYQVLHDFLTTGGDGQYPYGGLIAGNDGFLYGTTYAGGISGYGTLFKISHDGLEYGTLHHFGVSGDDGRDPYGSLMQTTNGTLYGTTGYGGTNGNGTVFKFDSGNSNLVVLHTFTGGATGGGFPFAELTQGSDGALYSTTRSGGTANQGTFFKLNPDGSEFAVLFSFTDAGGVGSGPYGGVVQDDAGNWYGTTRDGGGYSVGTIFKLELAAAAMGPLLTIVPGAPGFATVSWTPNDTNFVLQETLSLSPANWTNSPSGSTNPVVVSATLPTKLYRLLKP